MESVLLRVLRCNTFSNVEDGELFKSLAALVLFHLSQKLMILDTLRTCPGHVRDMSSLSMPLGGTQGRTLDSNIGTNKDFSNYMKMTFLYQFNKVRVTGIEYGNKK